MDAAARSAQPLQLQPSFDARLPPRSSTTTSARCSASAAFPDRRRGGRDVDAMLLGIARGALRPIADDLAA
jgi:hypothetical protein